MRTCKIHFPFEPVLTEIHVWNVANQVTVETVNNLTFYWESLSILRQGFKSFSKLFMKQLDVIIQFLNERPPNVILGKLYVIKTCIIKFNWAGTSIIMNVNNIVKIALMLILIAVFYINIAKCTNLHLCNFKHSFLSLLTLVLSFSSCMTKNFISASVKKKNEMHAHVIQLIITLTAECLSRIAICPAS